MHLPKIGGLSEQQRLSVRRGSCFFPTLLKSALRLVAFVICFVNHGPASSEDSKNMDRPSSSLSNSNPRSWLTDKPVGWLFNAQAGPRHRFIARWTFLRA